MIAALLLLLAGLVIIAVIIAVNGYFVAQEFAYMSVDRAALRASAERGDDSAARALTVTKRTSFMLSGAQLGITVTGLLVGYVAEPFVGESLGVLLGGIGVPAGVGIAVGTVAALVLATVVQMIFGELYPKNLAIANPEPLARALARSTLVYLAVFGWLITIFDKASDALLRFLRVEPVHDVDSSATAQDLEHIVDDSRESGHLPEELSILLDRILDFPNRDVEHAMVPRVQVGTVDAAATIADVRVEMARSHTRFPVMNDREELVGVVHLIDVLATDADDTRSVRAIMREPVTVPMVMPLPDVLDVLARSRNELACVIDEYGGLAGIVTVEDLAEELVGEITDEHDADPVPGAEHTGDGVWVVDGDVHVDEVERALGRDLPSGDYETMAGLVIAELERLPELGERLRVALPEEGGDFLDDERQHRYLSIEVTNVERHIPSEVRLTLVDSAETPPSADTPAQRDEGMGKR